MAGFKEVGEAARSRGWVSVLGALGVDTALLVNKHGPCPGCGGKDRFRFDDHDGKGTWICSSGGNGNLSGDGFGLLEHVFDWDKRELLRRVAEVVGLRVNVSLPLKTAGENAGVAAMPQPDKKPKRPEYDEGALTRFAKGCPYEIDRKWLAERSPVAVEWGVRQGLGLDFLSLIYEPGEVVLVFDNFYSQGDFAFYQRNGGEAFRLGREPGVKSVKSELPMSGKNGIWFLTNPVSGEWRPDKVAKMGRRHGGCVTSWRYAVLESDEAPPAVWMKALAQLALPIVAIYSSGGKSIHALVRVDATSKADFDAKRDKLVAVLCPLGADGGAISGVRLSRLPGCKRGNKGLQELFYLNPAARWGQRLLDFSPKREVSV